MVKIISFSWSNLTMKNGRGVIVKTRLDHRGGVIVLLAHF
jgi:hypothetical protein